MLDLGIFSRVTRQLRNLSLEIHNSQFEVLPRKTTQLRAAHRFLRLFRKRDFYRQPFAKPLFEECSAALRRLAQRPPLFAHSSDRSQRKKLVSDFAGPREIHIDALRRGLESLGARGFAIARSSRRNFPSSLAGVSAQPSIRSPGSKDSRPADRDRETNAGIPLRGVVFASSIPAKRRRPGAIRD